MICPIFALPLKNGHGLTHGVTVALQILVLSVKVRILMGQHKNLAFSGVFYFNLSKQLLKLACQSLI